MPSLPRADRAGAALPAAGEFRPPAALARRMRRRLLAWYRRHRRPLPWRDTRDPWAIWVSETMLQQTQVATVLHYYDPFLARFPTPGHFARARMAQVLAAWAGLGYYRRARHLHAAARIVVRDHGGHVPPDPAMFGALPGVGRYTQGAVLSIAFDRPLPVLDGNVARVLSRLFAVRGSVRLPAGQRTLWRLAGTLVPMHGAGDWNQALMELGATVCVPRRPRCGDCPVRGLCRARALGTPEAFPVRVPRRPPRHIRRAMALIEHGGRVLVVRREGTLLGGLWEPPGVDLDPGQRAAPALARALAALGVPVAGLRTARRTVRRALTHRTIAAELWRGTSGARTPGRIARVRWIDPARPPVPLTALGRDALAAPGASAPPRGPLTRARRL
jgi:A/G-specific adenine glycosylase